MDLTTFVGRFFRAVIFGLIAAVGFFMLFGPSPVFLLAGLVGVCLLFDVFAPAMIAASILVLVAGILVVSNLMPTWNVVAATEKAKAVVGPAMKNLEDRLDAAQDRKQQSLADRLMQLDDACRKGLISTTDCDASRATILQQFTTSSTR